MDIVEGESAIDEMFSTNEMSDMINDVLSMMGENSDGKKAEVKSEDIFDSILDLCTESWGCPLCAEKGTKAKVQLLQATENQAIYFCETADCLYPHNDDDDPVIVYRGLEELPPDASFLEKLGFPPSLADERGLTLKKVCDLFLIKYAYNKMDDWLKVEKELARQQNLIDKESTFQRNLTKIKINDKCSPVNRLRNIPDDLVRYVRHFIPNLEEVVELLKLDML
ncbi:Hypothetical protein NTJ_15549 [Nesidiocoris tenuis]|uniref:Uncharacterized protein n=1 Tax=Nesidiocoris tenuis TaxID=355587 RepID=A0ABN7BEN1_9HEMI|nr:Hypothetical protein NTJ_15549 [Nesidiocoris tenuis]